MIYMLLLISNIKNISGLFANNIKLKQIAIPPNITTIGECAFEKCNSLVKVSIPSSVTTIGYYAFNMCSSLRQVSIPSSVTLIDIYAFGICSSLIKISIPYSVREIDEKAFIGCKSIEHISIPPSITTIKASVFSGCESLNDFIIPTSVKTIDKFAFNNCTSLTQIDIPSSVKLIKDYAFNNCQSLSQVTIPPSVKSVEKKAFNQCVLLPDLNYQENSNDDNYQHSNLTVFFYIISVFVFLNLTAEFIITITWWLRIHPWFAHGYNSGKKVYQLLETCWISSILTYVNLAIYLFLTCFVLERNRVNRIRELKRKKRLSIIINSIFITLFFILSFMVIISGIIASSYALKNEKIDGKSYKCLNYMFDGYYGASNWVASQSEKKQNDFNEWHSKMLNKAFKTNGNASNFYCLEVGVPALIFAIIPCGALLYFMIAFIIIKYNLCLH